MGSAVRPAYGAGPTVDDAALTCARSGWEQYHDARREPLGHISQCFGVAAPLLHRDAAKVVCEPPEDRRPVEVFYGGRVPGA